jgi:diaminopimelate decarboxylase
VTDINPRIWPTGARRNSAGVLELGGIPVTELAESFGTPAFILDESDFRNRARAWRSAFEKAFGVDGCDVFYAGKAFLCMAIARWVHEEGLGLDVASGGELAVALAAGFPAERIAMHGNNKSVHEIDRAVAAGVGVIIIDSFLEIQRIANVAAARDVRQRVMVRVTPGVEAHTHEFIATAHEDVKFGFSLATGAAAEAVRQVLKAPPLDFVGIHSHIGSQVFDMSGFEVAAHRVVGLLAEIVSEHGIEVPHLDLGGGYGIAYVDSDDPLAPEQVAQALAQIVATECSVAGIPLPRVSIEPGRAIVGPTTVTLYSIGTTKTVDLDGGATRHYISVDGGMSDNIRTALYGAQYTAVIANRVSAAEPTRSRVVGKHCESGDIVIDEIALPRDGSAGDLLAVPATGAYHRSMASTYNHVPRPPVVAIRDGKARLILRRETEQDLLLLDVVEG